MEEEVEWCVGFHLFFLVLGSEWSGSILFFCNGGMKKIFLEVMVTDER